jgi:pimeloyl-ACP methyl ester carboxylesterase
MQFTRSQRIAFRLFALSFLIAFIALKVSAAHADAFKPTHFTVTVEGQGPDVIMIPGLACSSAVWRPEADKLKTHYRVHLIQVNGFAGTASGANASDPILAPTVDEIAAYIHANNLHPAIVGHSLGGLMGLMLAEKHPEAVTRLMIVDSLPFYGMLFGPQATVETVKPQATAMRDRVVAGTQAEYAAKEPEIIARLTKSHNAESDAVVAAAQASDHAVVARAMYEDMTTDMRPALPKIPTPTTVLYAFDASIGFPQAAVDGIYQSGYAALPNKRLVRIDNSYHFIQIDQPEAFDREVQTFLAAH